MTIQLFEKKFISYFGVTEVSGPSGILTILFVEEGSELIYFLHWLRWDVNLGKFLSSTSKRVCTLFFAKERVSIDLLDINC